jgi:hypothetical protein
MSSSWTHKYTHRNHSKQQQQHQHLNLKKKRMGIFGLKFKAKNEVHDIDAHANPMDYEEHDDIVADMLESPQWTHGNAGILRAGRPLFATLTRPENTFWVCPHYSINEQQVHTF